MTNPKLAVYYEHPHWYKALFAELEQRGIACDQQLAYNHQFDPCQRHSPYTLIINRMSPSAYTRGHAQAISYTLQYLAYLKDIGANVMNGYEAYVYEFSKARQLGLLEQLRVRYPRSRVINHPSQALAAAEGLAYPVIVKANIGGSGVGIARFNTPANLTEAIEANLIDMGHDHIALVQEYLPARGNSIVRVEVLNGQYLYAIRLQLKSGDTFNLCPGSYCQTPAPNGDASNQKPLIEGYTPSPQVIKTVEKIITTAHIDLGGIEYLVNDRDGEIYYYDINAMSNFVADAPNVIGFEPVPKLVDYLAQRSGLAEFAG